MEYARHILEVVVGVTLGLVAHGVVTTSPAADEALLAGLAFLFALALATHGLFTGVEAAVAAGTSADAGSSE